MALGGESGKTRKLVSLFVAAALVAAPGCGSRQVSAGECWDKNNDGYCDDDGSSVGGSYHYVNGSRVYARSGVSKSDGSYKASSGVSTGVSKGGIGSSSGSSSS
ncbi:hypothetical protein FE784_28600 [Paenibacillus hemerocallicola]|jgi:hypothetical protein|uniref:Uncharacterized protein n=1 Tax=Paenibacillus hemerocallicola TaxID=1172614 RepID=A0A5C4T279_9BACL|nr:hypothetical protein [Paenibacillus hemerocallicola]TNJ62860.1 hypothetical protein FE784_28600 [Paenibacillus hemerocallicola]